MKLTNTCICHTFMESKERRSKEEKNRIGETAPSKLLVYSIFGFCLVLLLKIVCNISWKLEMIFFPLGRRNSTWAQFYLRKKKY